MTPPQNVSKSESCSKSGCRETVVTAGAAGMSVQAKNTPKELFKNNLYILLVFSPDSTRGKSLT